MFRHCIIRTRSVCIRCFETAELDIHSINFKSCSTFDGQRSSFRRLFEFLCFNSARLAISSYCVNTFLFLSLSHRSKFKTHIAIEDFQLKIDVDSGPKQKSKKITQIETK